MATSSPASVAASATPLDLVIFGGVGDLSVRKLLPALYMAHLHNNLPAATRIHALGRQTWDRDGFLAFIGEKVPGFIEEKHFDDGTWASFLERLQFTSVDATRGEDFAALAATMQPGSDRVYYLATAPSLFVGICAHLHGAGLIDEREAQGLLNLTRNRSERRLVARRLADEGLHSGWRELRAMAEAGDETSVATLMRCLSRRRQQTDLEELRRWRDAGERRAGAELLRLDAARFTLAALDELRRLRDDGDRAAGERLYYLLAKRGTEDDLTELKACASDGDASAQKRLDEALAGQGDDQALTRLKAQAASGGAPSQRRVARALSRRGDDAAIELLRECADAGDGRRRDVQGGRPEHPDELRGCAVEGRHAGQHAHGVHVAEVKGGGVRREGQVGGRSG